MKARLTALALTALGMIGAAQAQVFGAASGYNAFVFGNFTSSNSDTEGRVAVGGNANFTNYDIGLMNPGGTALVVGGNLSMFGGTIRGNAVVGGTRSASNMSFQNGGSWQSGSPINFSQVQSQLLDLSTQWKGFGNSGIVRKPFSTVELVGNRSVNIFNVSASLLSSASDINILVPSGATALINVTGTGNITLPNFGYNFNGSQDRSNFQKVIWHVTDASTVSMNSLNGTIFAPKSDITGSWGQINGHLIAKSFNGPTQINHNPYNGASPVPEPFTMTALGAAALAWARRRKAKKA
jgi:choice-of-anchor A domain-containing protein